MTTKITNISPNCDCELVIGDENKVSFIVRGVVLYTTSVSSTQSQSILSSSISRDNVTIADGFIVNYVDAANINVSGIIFDNNLLYNLDAVKIS